MPDTGVAADVSAQRPRGRGPTPVYDPVMGDGFTTPDDAADVRADVEGALDAARAAVEAPAASSAIA